MGEERSRRGGHAYPVLPADDGESYASLRRRPTPRAERYELGRRCDTTRRVARWATGRRRVTAPTWSTRSTPRTRAGWTGWSRCGWRGWRPRRTGSYRGTAVVMAEDLAHLPATGITPVICGDAHLGNFGFYASPERDLVIDLNDFDESHPGGWEWDLRRLAASIWVAGRQNGLTEAQCEEAVESVVATYRLQVRWLAEQPLMGRSFDRLDVDQLTKTASEKSLRKEIKRASKRARTRVSDRALPRFTEQHEGGRRIVEEPPLITRIAEDQAEQLAEALDDYLTTLPPQWRRVLSGYTLVDVAHKVVGVGSVGLRAYVVLLEGSSAEDVVFLQLKQARRSVVAQYVHGGTAWHDHQGQRVVEYQQALQTVSDPLLGWATVDDRQYYVRQFRNMKGTIAVDSLDARALTDYAGICGRLLAKGHARTSGASMIAGYVGKGDNVDRALARFARLYADQTERDHQTLVDAVGLGRLPSEAGA